MHLLSSDDLSKEAINKIFSIADGIRTGTGMTSLREHSIMALYFEKPSTRTRMSLQVAMMQLGGDSIYIDPATSQRSRGETLEDTAKMMSSYCDFIAARMYKQSDIEKLAANSRVPVINALTDLEHPTQALADVYTIRNRKSSLKGARLAFIGDIAQNTANSLMLTAAKTGMQISLVGPKSYGPNHKYLNQAREYSEVFVTDSIEEGIEEADVIYTDTFVSMGEEAEADKRRALFAPYQLNQEAMQFAKETAIVMHPLPAHRGEEITADVLEGPRSVVWEQAKNKLLLNKAVVIYLSERE